MIRCLRAALLSGLSVMTAGALQSCVDQDYDINKELNLVINVCGNELSIPGSSTVAYSIGDMLALDSTSIIRPVNAIEAETYGLNEGDYCLIMDGGTTAEASFQTEVITLSVAAQKSTSHVEFPLFPELNGLPQSAVDAALAKLPKELTITFGNDGEQATEDGGYHQFKKAMVSKVEIAHSNIDPTIAGISHISTDFKFKTIFTLKITDYSGEATFKKGSKIVFGSNPNDFEVALGADAPSACSMNGNVLSFTRDYSIPNNTLSLPIEISGINLPSGSFANNTLRIAIPITTTGTLAMTRPTKADEVSNKQVKLDMITEAVGMDGGSIDCKILAVKGRFNPNFDAASVEMELGTMPEFLTANGNKLDLDNPQIYLTVNNGTPATVNVNIKLTGSYPADVTPVAPIEQKLTLTPGENKLCICAKSCNKDFTAVVIKRITDFVKTLPERITVELNASLDQSKDILLTLGQNYSFSAANSVVVPLAFGPEMQFTYTGSISGWNYQLSNYDFGEARIELDVVNDMPLSFVPDMTPLFVADAPNKLKIAVTGSIKAADTSHIEISIKSLGTVDGATINSGLNGLDGIKFSLSAKDPAVGQAFNVANSLKIENLRVRLLGGVTTTLK